MTSDPSPCPGSPLNVVTGAFGFTGRHIAAALLKMGERVRTLTNHPRPGSGGVAVEVAPLDFSRPQALTRSLEGTAVLYNTYWVRFSYGNVTHQGAVENSRVLIRAAREAGVRRIVHLSVTNPSPDSPLPYFRGKAQVEDAIRDSGLSYAILRPALIFGEEDILINNIAWLLRRFSIFAIPGSGQYRLQPVHVDDLASLAVAGGHAREDFVSDAVGPETYTYDELVRLIAGMVGSRSRIVHLPASVVWLASRLAGRVVGDVLLTRDEIRGLMADLLFSREPPRGTTSFQSWLQAHADSLGRQYASELARHYRRVR